MIIEHADKPDSQILLENITHTLLYEGYALFPYHRSAVKNQKPVPFGVVFPQHYNSYNEHAHSGIRAQCIVTGSEDPLVNISVRFLHLKKTELLERLVQGNGIHDFTPVTDLDVNGKSYQAGWQTIERTISTGDLPVSQFLKSGKVFFIEFDKMYDSKSIYYEGGEVAAKQINSVSEIRGAVSIEAAQIENIHNAFRIAIHITNTTPVEHAESVTRDDILSQSFLSTHTILQTKNGEFISQQNPPEKWRAAMEENKNINTWPILIDENNTTLLASPIILYDYPRINPQSSGDLFDSTEIEEALLLHVGVLSDDEKKRIARSDEKLQTMLNKVSQITPEEFINFHSRLKDNTQDQINRQKSGE